MDMPEKLSIRDDESYHSRNLSSKLQLRGDDNFGKGFHVLNDVRPSVTQDRMRRLHQMGSESNLIAHRARQNEYPGFMSCEVGYVSLK